MDKKKLESKIIEILKNVFTELDIDSEINGLYAGLKLGGREGRLWIYIATIVETSYSDGLKVIRNKFEEEFMKDEWVKNNTDFNNVVLILEKFSNDPSDIKEFYNSMEYALLEPIIEGFNNPFKTTSDEKTISDYNKEDTLTNTKLWDELIISGYNEKDETLIMDKLNKRKILMFGSEELEIKESNTGLFKPVSRILLETIEYELSALHPDLSVDGYFIDIREDTKEITLLVFIKGYSYIPTNATGSAITEEIELNISDLFNLMLNPNKFNRVDYNIRTKCFDCKYNPYNK